MPSFTITMPDIQQGPAYLWFGVQVPSTGNRLLVDASGNLTQGNPYPMGSSEGAATFHASAKIEPISIDQETAPVDAVMTAETAYIEFNLKESSLQKLYYAVAHTTYSAGSDSNLPAGATQYEELTAGGLIPLPQAAIAMVSPRRGFSNPGKYFVACLYNAFASDPLQIGFTRTKESIYKVKWEGLAVLTRTQGDRVCQFYRQI